MAAQFLQEQSEGQDEDRAAKFCVVCGELATHERMQCLFEDPTVSIHHDCFSKTMQPIYGDSALTIFTHLYGAEAAGFALKAARIAPGPPDPVGGFDTIIYLTGELEQKVEWYQNRNGKGGTKRGQNLPFIARVLSGEIQVSEKDLERLGFIEVGPYGPTADSAAVKWGVVDLKPVFSPGVETRRPKRW